VNKKVLRKIEEFVEFLKRYDYVLDTEIGERCCDGCPAYETCQFNKITLRDVLLYLEALIADYEVEPLSKLVYEFISSRRSGETFSTRELYAFLEKNGIRVDKHVIGKLRWILKDLKEKGVLQYSGQEVICRNGKPTTITYYEIC